MTPLKAASAAIMFVVSLSTAAGAQENSRERLDDRIRQWIQDLDSDEFHVREAATRDLIDAGSRAVEPVSQAALSGNLEVGCRAFDILVKLSGSRDHRTEQAALAALERIADAPYVGAGLTRLWRVARNREAVLEIRSLGGKVTSLSAGSIMVHVGSDWKGGQAGLVHLRRLDKLRHLSFEHSSLGDSDLVQIKDLTQLTHVAWTTLR